MRAVATLLLVVTGLVAAVPEVTYIGGDGIMIASAGVTTIVQFERESVGKCYPFSDQIDVSATAQLGDGLTYVGGRHLLKVKDNTFEIFGCQMNGPSLENSAVKCSRAQNGTITSLFGRANSGRSFSYIEAEKLVQFDSKSGEFALHRFTKNEVCTSSSGNCGFQTSPLAQGNFETFCAGVDSFGPGSGSFQVLGSSIDEMMVVCRDQAAYVILKVYPAASASEAYSLQIVRSGGIASTNKLESLGGSLVLAHNDQLQYGIYDCGTSTCQRVSSGNLTAESPCKYNVKTSCLADAKCGWCVDTSKCMQAGDGKPCGEYCQTWQATHDHEAVTPSVHLGVEERQISHIADGVFIHYTSPSGSYELYAVVDNHPTHAGKCPAIGSTPLYKGSLPFRYFIASPFGKRSVLFHNPEDGRYNLWHCHQFSFEQHLGTAAPCSTIASGQFEPFKGVHNMLTEKNYTISFNDNTGRIELFNNTVRSLDGSEDELTSMSMFKGPNATIHMPEMKSHRLFSIGNGYLMERSVATGEYHIWQIDLNTKQIIGPGARGEISIQKYIHLAWMGDDRIVALSDNGDYLMLRFDQTMLGFTAPVSFTTLGRGHLGEELCKYENCQECGGDSRCGWCASSGKCMVGSADRPCDDGSHSICTSWMKGYCANTSCPSRQLRSTCIADGECGWCEDSAMCLRQVNGTAALCGGKLTIDSSEFSGGHHAHHA